MSRSLAVIDDGENKEWASRLSKLVDRTDKGDKAAVAELREFFDEAPSLWEQCGNLAVQAERAWVSLVDGGNPVVNEAFCKKLAKMRAELAGGESSPLERLLAERIAACWLQVQFADAKYAWSLNDGMSLEQGDYYQRCQERAHRRYISAIRALAQVRRLLAPAVQLNIAERQVNIGPGQ